MTNREIIAIPGQGTPLPLPVKNSGDKVQVMPSLLLQAGLKNFAKGPQACEKIPAKNAFICFKIILKDTFNSFFAGSHWQPSQIWSIINRNFDGKWQPKRQPMAAKSGGTPDAPSGCPNFNEEKFL